MATRHVLAEIAAAAHAPTSPAAYAAGLPLLEIESMGGVLAAERVAGGEVCDLVFLAQGALLRLAADGHVDAATVTPLMLSHTAVAVRDTDVVFAEGSPETMAFASAAEFRAALHAAPTIGYSTGPSGTALLHLLREWGDFDALEPRLVQARPGVPVAQLVAAGEAAVGLQQLSELVGQPGIRILGVLPPACAIDTVFSGAVASTAADPKAATELLRFFSGPEAVARLRAHAFSPAPAHG